MTLISSGELPRLVQVGRDVNLVQIHGTRGMHDTHDMHAIDLSSWLPGDDLEDDAPCTARTLRTPSQLTRAGCH
jgi:hypothetical protein